MKSLVRFVAALAVVATSVAFALPSAQDSAKPAAGKAEAPKVIVPFFGNDTCPISGKPINKAKFVESEGQRAYYCCANCLGKAKADPKAAIAAAYKETKAVANKCCPVSGEAIEEGKGVAATWQGQKVMLCCADCSAAFAKTPLLFVTKAVYSADDLKNAKCPVMDEESEADDLVVYKGHIVRLCCGDCSAEFAKEPDKFLAKAGGK